MPRQPKGRPGQGGQTTTDDALASVTSLADIGAARGERWRVMWRTALAEAAAECAERRKRVLSHPDLRDRLAAELGYADASQWNGYVPPATWNQARNDSPRRASLVAICSEALSREQVGA
jgi:hypothetical protein